MIRGLLDRNAVAAFVDWLSLLAVASGCSQRTYCFVMFAGTQQAHCQTTAKGFSVAKHSAIMADRRALLRPVRFLPRYAVFQHVANFFESCLIHIGLCEFYRIDFVTGIRRNLCDLRGSDIVVLTDRSDYVFTPCLRQTAQDRFESVHRRRWMGEKFAVVCVQRVEHIH